MSFTGDLEHLPIVDVIQLLHATRKSGTLGVRSRRGQCELVFRDGYIVSANHSQNMVRIGQVLTDMKAITGEILERALEEQKAAGSRRKPLIATLLEGGHIDRETAYKGLETLIELSIVDILTWTTGTFSLDVDKVVISDEYRYFPEHLQQEISLNTQNILMDALRIFDEMKRDGHLPAETEEAEENQEKAAGSEAAGTDLQADPVDLPPSSSVPPVPGAPADIPGISAADLGLADLDQLDRQIPAVFSGLPDPLEDPAETRRQEVQAAGPGLAPDEQERLLAYLQTLSSDREEKGTSRAEGLSRALILFSPDHLLRYAVMAACKETGTPVFTTDDDTDLPPILEQSLVKGIVPVLVFDGPDASGRGADERQVIELRQQMRRKYPDIPVIQLCSPLGYDFSLQAFREGIPVVLPRPFRGERPASFIEDLIKFLDAFHCCLREWGGREADRQLWPLRDALSALRRLREPPEVAFALLRHIAGQFERALTLVVARNELVAERGIGLREGREPVARPGIRIPLAEPSIFRRAVEKGELFYGPATDPVLQGRLFSAIGPPRHSAVLLLPMRMHGRTVSLTYADFGTREPAIVRPPLLEILSSQAELVLENAYQRKKLERVPQ